MIYGSTSSFNGACNTLFILIYQFSMVILYLYMTYSMDLEPFSMVILYFYTTYSIEHWTIFNGSTLYIYNICGSISTYISNILCITDTDTMVLLNLCSVFDSTRMHLHLNSMS